MFKVALVNMPFAVAFLPSFALTQLRSVVRSNLGDRVDPRIFYLNHDFARHFNPRLYDAVSNSIEAVTTGLGDWIFRPAAFPELLDNTDDYVLRHFAGHRSWMGLMPVLLEKRRTIGAFLDAVIDRYELDGCSLVGFTTMFSQNVASIALARRLKERNPSVVTVLGGANCETSMGRVLAGRVEAMDFVFSGPALRSFPELVRRVADGDVDGCHELTGVYSRRKLARLAPGTPAEIGPDLDIDVEVPLDYDDFLASFDEKLGAATAPPQLFFETSRGCWWGERAHCTFCGLNGVSMQYRAMRPEKALPYMQALLDRYGARVREYQSIDNIMPREYLREVFPHLRPPEGVSLFYEVKADLKDHELEVLARAGVTQLQPGIEALATATLKLMKKGTTSFQNLALLMSCRVHGIQPRWNLLMGFPGEPEEVYRKYVDDLPLFTHLPPPAGAFPVRFDRFSPYHKQAVEHGLKLRPYDFYSMIYPFAAEDLEELAYYFVDENLDAPYFANTAKWIGEVRRRIQLWHQRWHGKDGGLPPRLAFRVTDRGRAVYDSRSGEAVEHEVGETGLRILERLGRQMRPARLAEQLPGLTPAEVETEIQALRARGLLFEEDGLYMSLVLEEREEEPVLAALRDEAIVAEVAGM